MRKSKEFQNILDKCLERMDQGETIEQCLRSFPEDAGMLEPLLTTALATKKALDIQPSHEFRERARYQFYSALQEMGRKKSRPAFSWSWQPRWVAVMAIVLTILLAGGGTVATASGSMPGELLYPVKLATEQVQLVLTPSALRKAEFYAKLADKRVIEIVHLVGQDKPEQVELTAQRLDTYLTKIVDLASPQEATHRDALMMAPATVESRPALREAQPPTGPEKSAQDMKAQTPDERRAEVRAELTNDASDNSARLRALLETAPQSAKPALLQAIAVAEAGYKKAIKSLDQP